MTIERDCTECDTGTVEHYFLLHRAEPDVGYMQGWAEYDYTTPCSDCGTVPELSDDDIDQLAYEAVHEEGR